MSKLMGDRFLAETHTLPFDLTHALPDLPKVLGDLVDAASSGLSTPAIDPAVLAADLKVRWLCVRVCWGGGFVIWGVGGRWDRGQGCVYLSCLRRSHTIGVLSTFLTHHHSFTLVC